MNEINLDQVDDLELRAKLEAALKPQERVKRVPQVPGTIGFETCARIRAKYDDDPDFAWTKQDTLDMVIDIVTWAHDKNLDTKFKNTHVSYFRSVLKKNEDIG